MAGSHSDPVSKDILFSFSYELHKGSDQKKLDAFLLLLALQTCAPLISQSGSTCFHSYCSLRSTLIPKLKKHSVYLSSSRTCCRMKSQNYPQIRATTGMLRRSFMQTMTASCEQRLPARLPVDLAIYFDFFLKFRKHKESL